MTKKAPFTIPSRILVRKGAKRNILQTMQLEEVRDYLKKLNDVMEPRDHRVGLHRLRVSFNGGQMTAAFVNPSQPGGLDPSMKLMSQGASQLHSLVLPSRFWSGFKQLVALDPNLAAQVWKKFGDLQYKKRRVVRTTRMSWCPGCGGVPRPHCGHKGREIHRAIRAVVSDRYGLYSNLEMVEDILSKSAHFASMPVLSWVVSDSGIRLRFLGMDPATAAFAGFDPAAVLASEPLPMIEVWNSEVGASAVGMAGGIWNTKTASGLGHWDDSSSFRWRHVGRSTRISQGVQGSFLTLTKVAQDVLEAYKDARNLTMEDPEAWLRDQLGKKGKKAALIPERVLEAAIVALNDPDVTPGSKLATVVDALTVAASNESDIYTAADVERAAARLMFRGAKIAERNGGNIPAPVVVEEA
jgi:hypothetical protein